MTNYANEILELKQRVAKLEKQIALILQQNGLRYRDEPDMGVSPEIINLVRQGKKIEAIRIYREETGVGLKQAKDFVDSLGI